MAIGKIISSVNTTVICHQTEQQAHVASRKLEKSHSEEVEFPN
jgi:hypothetical protein